MKMLVVWALVCFAAILGTQAQYQWSCSPLDTANNRYLLPDLGIRDAEDAAAMGQHLFTSNESVYIIFRLPPELNCSGTVTAVQFCYIGGALSSGRERQIFRLLILQESNSTFTVTNRVLARSTQSEQICMLRVFPTAGLFLYCCDVLKLDLSDYFELPAPGFAFGVESIYRLLTYNPLQNENDHLKVAQYRFHLETHSSTVGSTFEFNEDDVIKDRALRLLQFYITTPDHSAAPPIASSSTEPVTTTATTDQTTTPSSEQPTIETTEVDSPGPNTDVTTTETDHEQPTTSSTTETITGAPTNTDVSMEVTTLSPQGPGSTVPPTRLPTTSSVNTTTPRDHSTNISDTEFTGTGKHSFIVGGVVGVVGVGLISLAVIASVLLLLRRRKRKQNSTRLSVPQETAMEDIQSTPNNAYNEVANRNLSDSTYEDMADITTSSKMLITQNSAYVPTPSILVQANVAYAPTPSIPAGASAAYCSASTGNGIGPANELYSTARGDEPLDYSQDNLLSDYYYIS